MREIRQARVCFPTSFNFLQHPACPFRANFSIWGRRDPLSSLSVQCIPHVFTQPRAYRSTNDSRWVPTTKDVNVIWPHQVFISLDFRYVTFFFFSNILLEYLNNQTTSIRAPNRPPNFFSVSYMNNMNSSSACVLPETVGRFFSACCVTVNQAAHGVTISHHQRWLLERSR